MVKWLLLLLSVFLLSGCFCTKTITVIAPSEIFVPEYNDYNVTVNAIKKDGKITLSIKEFNDRTRQINSLKAHGSSVNEIVKKYNKSNKEIRNEQYEY